MPWHEKCGRLGRRHAPALALLFFIVADPLVAQGKFPPEALKNVQAMPQGTTVRQVVETMRGFTRALGVRCTHCHVGTEGQPLETMDFVADTKAAKRTARAMIRMVQAINGEHLAKLEERADPNVSVACATCHRGVAKPRSLIDELLLSYKSGGLGASSPRCAWWRASSTRRSSRSSGRSPCGRDPTWSSGSKP